MSGAWGENVHELQAYGSESRRGRVQRLDEDVPKETQQLQETKRTTLKGYNSMNSRVTLKTGCLGPDQGHKRSQLAEAVTSAAGVGATKTISNGSARSVLGGSVSTCTEQELVFLFICLLEMRWPVCLGALTCVCVHVEGRGQLQLYQPACFFCYIVFISWGGGNAAVH